MNNKKIQIIILILVILGAGFYFFNEFYNKQEQETFTVTLDEIAEFKVIRQDLTDEQIDKYKSEFEENVNESMQSNEKFVFNALNRIGMIKKIMHDFNGAEKVWMYMIVHRPENSVVYFNLGNLYMEDLKDNEKAEKAFLLALENSANESANEQYYRGIVTFYTYSYPEKKQEIEKILFNALEMEQYENSQTLMALLATYYQNNNQKEKAVEYWEKVLEIDPNNEAVMGEIKRLE